MACRVTCERALNVAKNWEYVSCTARTVQGNDFELILMARMETRHPVEGSFSSEFSVICNHCVVLAAWSRKTLKFCEKCLRFSGKTTPYAKIFKMLFRKFSSRHRLTLLCSNVVKFVKWEIVCYLVDKKKQNFACLSNCRYCSDRAENLPEPAPNNVLLC